MMTHEEYTAKVFEIETQMRQSKIDEAQAKNRAIEAQNLEHRRLKMELHNAIQAVNMRTRQQLTDIHDRFVQERTLLWSQHNKLTHQWKEEHGILPPPFVELPAEERPNEKGGIV